jgi:hypothetical protein
LRPDDPHAGRPTAASDLVPSDEVPAIDADLPPVPPDELEAFFVQVSIGNFLAAVEADEEARATADPVPPDPGSTPGAGGDVLACIRAHESDTAGGYAAVSPDGTYRGAYQFLPSTWNATAADAGRPDLVGVDPAGASPADQDALASHLYAQAGSQPWGGRC